MSLFILRTLCFMTILIVTVLPGRLLADEEGTPEDAVEMETIFVTASRFPERTEEVPASVSVIPGEEIEARHALSLDHVLDSVSGIHIFRQGSLGEESNLRLRGASFNQVLVLIDGVKANSPLTGEFDFGDILAEQFDRVEIVRGSQSALYGSEAMGGVVNLISARGSGPNRTSLLAEGGSRGTFHALASATGETDQVRYSLAVSRTDVDIRDKFDSFSANAFSGQLEIDLAESTTLQASSRYLGSEKELGIFFYWPGDAADPGIPSIEGPITFTRDPNRDLERERLFSSLGLTHEFYDWWTMEVRGGLVLDDLHERNETDPDAAYVTMMERFNADARRLVAVVQNRVRIGDLDTIVAGFEYTEDHLSQDEYGNLDSAGYGPPGFSSLDSERRNNAFFLQNTFHWRDSLFLSAGFRMDNNNDYGNEFSPKGSLAYYITSTDTWLRAGSGVGFRAPTFSELHTPGFGNPDLDAERSISYEAGFEQGLFDWRLRIGATYFHIEYDELIGANPGFDPFDPSSKWLINVGEAFTRGVEAEIHILPIEGLDLGAGYTYLETEDRDTGDELPGRPRHQTHLSAAYTRGPIGARMDAHIVGSHFDNLDFIDIHGERSSGRQPGYSRLDLAFSYSIESPCRGLDQFIPHIRLANLLDADYEEVGGFPAPGFAVNLGFRSYF